MPSEGLSVKKKNLGKKNNSTGYLNKQENCRDILLYIQISKIFFNFCMSITK